MFARPTTSNPKRRISQNSPSHQNRASPIADGANITPRATVPQPLEELAEVLWSEEPGIPQNILARPHTSNPRYVEMNLRDTPRKDAAKEQTVSSQASGGGCTSPSSATPSERGSIDQPGGVLWASESGTIDPKMLARPVTANPWLRRLFESGVLPEDNWTKKESQILWSSIDVEDWRMLARPHASNPLLERGIVDDPKSGVEPSPTVAHAHSEVLWKREDEEPPAAGTSTDVLPIPSLDMGIATAILSTVNEQSDRIRALENEVIDLKQLIIGLTSIVQSQFTQQSQQLSAIAMSHQQHCVTLIEPSPITSQQPSATVPPLHASAFKRHSHQAAECDDAVCRLTMSVDSRLGDDTVKYVADPSVMGVSPSDVPMPRDDYPSFIAPSPPRGAAVALPGTKLDAGNLVANRRDLKLESSQPDVTAREDYEKFIKEDNSAIEPRLEGTDHHPSHQAADVTRPETASSVASRRVVQLRETIAQQNGSIRPQSAPLRHYADRHGSNKHTFNTTTFDKEGSNAILLNHAAIKEQYERLIRPTHHFVLKKDFKDMYLKKSEDFGLCISEREIDRKLEAFHGAGKEYLSFEEFSVLFLNIAKW